MGPRRDRSNEPLICTQCSAPSPHPNEPASIIQVATKWIALDVAVSSLDVAKDEETPWTAGGVDCGKTALFSITTKKLSHGAQHNFGDATNSERSALGCM